MVVARSGPPGGTAIEESGGCPGGGGNRAPHQLSGTSKGPDRANDQSVGPDFPTQGRCAPTMTRAGRRVSFDESLRQNSPVSLRTLFRSRASLGSEQETFVETVSEIDKPVWRFERTRRGRRPELKSKACQRRTGRQVRRIDLTTDEAPGELQGPRPVA